MHITVKQFSGQPLPPFSFPVLCKGQNSGKPLDTTCPNCFIVTCANDQEMQLFKQVSWALWTSKRFEFWLRGSVIPFITISDYSRLLLATAVKAAANPNKCAAAIKTMQQLKEFRKLKLEEAKTAQELQMAVFQKFLQ